MTTTTLPCYVINLPTDSMRREAITQHLTHRSIDATIFNAFDGRNLPKEALYQHVNEPRLLKEYGPISNPEIGCALSHISIYKDIVSKKLELAVILEDDVHVSTDFCSLIDATSNGFINNYLSGDQPKMLQLTHVKRGYRFSKVAINKKYHLFKPASTVWLTSGYIINLAAAKALSTSLYPIWTVADHWSRFQEKGLVALHALSPPAVWESPDAARSSIGTERAPRLKRKKTPSQKLSNYYLKLSGRLSPRSTQNEPDHSIIKTKVLA